MLTSRAWWFLLLSLVMLALGLLRPSLSLTLLGLTLLLWFATQWLWFLIRLPVVGRLRVEREVWDERSTVATLWAGKTFEVRVRLLHDGWLPSPHLAVADHLPFTLNLLDGSVHTQGVLASDETLELSYRIQCGPAGAARFEGVRIQAADGQGFFYHVRFLHGLVLLPILPLLAPRVGQPTSTKRHNLLLPPGIHRYRQPGSGSELLDLRDYLPGDPPKTIAWKVSARRDRLITKEFESEVPVRCTLFVDTSSSVRVPALVGEKSAGDEDRSDKGWATFGRAKALDRLIEIAAGVLHANESIRDLTGLCIFDEQDARGLAPDRGPIHRSECLRRLAEAATLTPGLQRLDPDSLVPLAHTLAGHVYPELLNRRVNSIPLAMRWLEGFSGYSRRLRLGLFELLHRRKSALRTLCWWTSFWSLLLPVSLLVLRFQIMAGAPREPGRKTPVLDALLLAAIFLAPVATVGVWGIAAFLFGLDAVTGGSKRRRDRTRKQMAAIVSARYGLAPGGLATLLEDDDALTLLLQRFLNEHQVPFALPLYDTQGRYLFAAPEKAHVLAESLLRAVGKGRDNELFVLLADLLELDEMALEPLLRAVRVARGRHHHVMLVCPWPPGLELPSNRGEKDDTMSLPSGASSLIPGRLWERLTTQRFHRAYQRLRHTFTRMGVAVLCAAAEEPVPLILSRIERLRGAGRPHS